MASFSKKSVYLIQFFFGMFFLIGGTLTLPQGRFLYSLWVMSIGALMLFHSIRELLESRFSPAVLTLLHYAIAITVLISGIIVLFTNYYAP